MCPRGRGRRLWLVFGSLTLGCSDPVCPGPPGSPTGIVCVIVVAVFRFEKNF